MPRTRKPKPLDVPETILDQFAGPARPMSPIEVDAITKRFEKALVERMLGGELTHHLGYPPAGRTPRTPAISAMAGAEATAAALEAFAQGPWRRRFPTVVASWRRAWAHVIPFFAFPPAIRRVIYTTNALESVHARLRKIIKTRGHFPTDAAATKLIWLALRNITASWWKAANYWPQAMNQFAILYEDRFTRPLRRMPRRMDAAVPVDAQNAPTAHTHRRAPHTKFRTLPARLAGQLLRHPSRICVITNPALCFLCVSVADLLCGSVAPTLEVWV